MKERQLSGFERRVYSRVRDICEVLVKPCERKVDCPLEGAVEFEWKGTTRNISAGGLLFSLDQDLPVNTRIMVEVIIPHWQKYAIVADRVRHKLPGGHSLVPFRAQGIIIRRTWDDEARAYEMALFFTNMNPDDKQALLKFVEYREHELAFRQ